MLRDCWLYLLLFVLVCGFTIIVLHLLDMNSRLICFVFVFVFLFVVVFVFVA